MSHTQGSNDNTAVVETFKEALIQRVGMELFQAWFVTGVEFTLGEDTKSELRIVVQAHRQFTLDRLRRNYLREMRAAAQAVQRGAQLELRLSGRPKQIELPLDVDGSTDDGLSTTWDGIQKASSNVAALSATDQASSSLASSRGIIKPRPRPRVSDLVQPTLPNMPAEVGFPVSPVSSDSNNDRNEQAVGAKNKSTRQTTAVDLDSDNLTGSKAGNSGTKRRVTLDTFIPGKCNQLARTAADMVCESPRTASPLFFAGPAGVGKTHLMLALTEAFRRQHAMKKVVYISAEEFTNDFIQAVSNHNLASFRARYRELDALLVDDVQFLSAKKATIREMLYNLQWLTDRGKAIVFAASHTPNEISGVTQELAGRMSSGLVCTMQPLDSTTRESLLREHIARWCQFPWPDDSVKEVNTVLAGDGRRILGVVRLVAALQRMYQRMPTLGEIREAGGDLLRTDQLVVTLSRIERAVAEVFQLHDNTLQSKSQARNATEPRMLAMYLSRQLTPAAFAEIGKHYGGRSHSAAILAIQRVESWLETGKPIGRGAAALTARQALDRIESLLRSG